jgi:hypothetical protein
MHFAILSGWLFVMNPETAPLGTTSRGRKHYEVSMPMPSNNCDVYFGACPECRKPGHYLNVRKAIWFVCDEHKKRWSGGYGLFSSWYSENEEVWERNQKLLATYDECKPYYPDEPYYPDDPECEPYYPDDPVLDEDEGQGEGFDTVD